VPQKVAESVPKPHHVVRNPRHFANIPSNTMPTIHQQILARDVSGVIAAPISDSLLPEIHAPFPDIYCQTFVREKCTEKQL
jgi:hypothetical protein